MHNLIFAILCSVAVSVLLKVARKKNIIIEQAIAFNYIVAISLSYFLLKPDFKGLEFTEYLAQSDSTPIFLALGILLPTVFIIMSKAVEFAGIVRSDAAQRLSLFLPIVASFIIFHETLSQPKIVGIILAFIGLFCILNKSNDGFYIANEDLKLRGPGDFFGVRQSGMMDFVLADIYTNADIMKQAADAVKQLEESGFDFSNLKNSRLEKQIGLARNI